MSQPYLGDEVTRSSTAVSSRSEFITRTYTHLLGAIAFFLAIEVWLFQSGIADTIAHAMLGTSWLLVIGGFMILSWLASSVAASSLSKPAQYAALAAFVTGQAIVFVPLLYIANAVAPGAINSAGILTAIGFIGLTGVAFVSRTDFSFMGAMLRWAFVVALLLIVGSLLFGFELGTWFSVAMVGLAGAAILNDTSNIIRHFPDDRYVAAALQLFASVALLFWYILRIFIGARR
ncbi:MAG: Bax inhibitor-1 family protein [Deltaproteobacteria bacterium]|nr:Bax inhibitor-1 family protein [Deltaproteobacteria bacterium]